MAKFYEVIECMDRGEYNSNFGLLKKYGVRLSEVGTNTMFPKEVLIQQKPETARPNRGDKIYGEINELTSARGAWYKFKKEQVPDELRQGGNARMDTPKPIGSMLPDVGDSNLTKKIDYITELLERLNDSAVVEEVKAKYFEPKTVPNEPVEPEYDFGDSPIDLSDLPF